MSVLVKGMKMPENCLSCPMQFGGWCFVAPAEIDERVAPTVDEAWEHGKPKWCPLVEVPTPHGRLVEFIDVITRVNEDSGTEEVCFGDVFKAYYEMKKAPAVIEAEE